MHSINNVHLLNCMYGYWALYVKFNKLYSYFKLWITWLTLTVSNYKFVIFVYTYLYIILYLWTYLSKLLGYFDIKYNDISNIVDSLANVHSFNFASIMYLSSSCLFLSNHLFILLSEVHKLAYPFILAIHVHRSGM